MTFDRTNGWRTEFGMALEDPAVFFSTKDDLRTHHMQATQGHLLRRAFDLLKLDGVLCAEDVPLVYFKELKRIEAADVVRLHRAFWNHGGAPVLVLIAPDQVHVYSGLVPPAPAKKGRLHLPAFVQALQRASVALREFLPSVQSGDFFRRHHQSFDPTRRVDRNLLDNLQATREKLLTASEKKLDADVLDGLLCRLVFASYLFDRKVIRPSYLQAAGLPTISHLRDILGLRPRSKAKRHLYDLFRQLGKDFNGDLFSDDLDVEARQVEVSCIDPLDEFFRATDADGQGSFWPYDFAAIPIETISAIYERFLKSANKKEGAFYTPRFLAEIVLDRALVSVPTLLGHRYLDPACGSGIFLVGLFNRMAEEWRQKYPEARNDRRARELRTVLCANLYGVDVNPTACRITAFSLYLAYLDQLSPRDIQELQDKGHKLPRLVHFKDGDNAQVEGNIWCADFFAENANYPIDADLVVGNPPWGSIARDDTAAALWCEKHNYPIADKQISAAFAWKASRHVSNAGIVCLILPHGTLFNHGDTALAFQRAFVSRCTIDHVLNLADYQFFLFEEARHPALVVTYRASVPTRQHLIEYWGPKTDWLVTRTEIIAVLPQDRCSLAVGDVLDDLDGADAPQIWKQRYWASARDSRLVARLSLYPRLRDKVGQPKEGSTAKPWLIAEGFQPLGENDDPAKKKILTLPTNLFVEATSPNLNLVLDPQDCKNLASTRVTIRSKSNTRTDIYVAPHVLVAKGFTSVAFADFDVAFRHALRGITGPKKDRDLLIFLAGYLRSPLARYFLFQTSSNWGISRQEVHVEELLRLPFLPPEATPNPRRAREIVSEVSELVTTALTKAVDDFVDRADLVAATDEAIEPLIDEYFDILPIEKVLISDTLEFIIPSVRPTRSRSIVPTIVPSKPGQREIYNTRLCATLNSWSKNSSMKVQGQTLASGKLGIGVVVLQTLRRDEGLIDIPDDIESLLVALNSLRRASSHILNTFELFRGVKVFEGNRLYIVKPIGQRFWTESAALNDADEIATTVLMQRTKGAA
jgi:hypothetical protein